MIRIIHDNLDGIASSYKGLLKKWLYYNEDYVNGKPKDRILKITATHTNDEYVEMLEFFHDNFDKLILINSLESFQTEATKFKSKFRSQILEYERADKDDKNDTSFGLFKNKMKYFYDNFFSDEYQGAQKSYFGFNNGGWLTKTLAMNTCPYCNRQYTFTICSDQGNLKTRPELDHFYPKSVYPYFALSFYNLIPSCPTCNRIKLEHELDHHPYMHEFGSESKFIVRTIDGCDINPWVIGKEDITIDFSSKNKNIKRLGLTELYNEHVDYVVEIMDKCVAYNASYYESLTDSFKGLAKTDDEIERIIWGSYLEIAEHKKRPLSKLTRDILDQFGIK